MNRNWRRRATWSVLLVSTLLATAVAWADDVPTTQPSSDPETSSNNRDFFTLRPAQMYLEIEGEWDQRRVTSSIPRRRDQDHRNRDFRLDESLGLVLDGDIYDPNLFEYNAALKFGSTQTFFKEQTNFYTDHDQDCTFLHDYDISFDMLQNKPISVHGYARRFEQRVPRRFLPTLRELYLESGVSALAVAGPTTTELGFNWQDVTRTGNRGDIDNEEIEVGRLYLDHNWAITDHQNLRLQYQHSREESMYQGSKYNFDTRRDELRLEHNLAFGPAHRHELNTFFRVNEEQGDLARDEIELTPRLKLQHTDKFQTIYRYGMYRFDQGSIRTNQHKFDVQALYRPIEDLRLSADGYGMYERTDGEVDTQEFGSGLDASYQRQTSSGTLALNAAFAYHHSRSDGDGGRRAVRNEAHQIDGPRPTYLRERNILIRTIRAHNRTRTRYYVRGIDYYVVRVGDRTRVRRSLGGRIPVNEVVYFDYEYRVPADSNIHGYRSDLLVEHAFDFGLTPYYAYESRCEDLSSSSRFSRGRDNTHRNRFGLRYAKTRYEVGTEGEFFDDSIEPYNAWHLTGRAAVLNASEHSLDWSGVLSRYWFKGGVDDRDVWWFDTDLIDRVRLNQNWSLLSQLSYHWEEDTSDGTTNGVDLEVGVEFVRGALSVDMTFEYDLLSFASSEENGVGVYLNVRRDLSHMLDGLAKK